jgi:hypothetical protein
VLLISGGGISSSSLEIISGGGGLAELIVDGLAVLIFVEVFCVVECFDFV